MFDVGSMAWTWKIIYRRLDEVVQIHAVLDGRRNLEDILMERMLKS